VQRSADPGSPTVEALLDNIRSTYNVGSMFRAADGAGLRHLHLCGITPTPENPKVAKTALGTEKSLPWDYSRNSVIAARALKRRGFKLFSLEANLQAISIFELDLARIEDPILLVVGNEINGVDPELLSVSDQVVWIPMQGEKESLNVSLAFGIAAYTLRFSCKKRYI
jgi:23S rRNA (guanosine2251-2'-O)-methyltransferase